MSHQADRSIHPADRLIHAADRSIHAADRSIHAADRSIHAAAWTDDKINVISILITHLYKVLCRQILETAPWMDIPVYYQPFQLFIKIMCYIPDLIGFVPSPYAK